jgi:hypothetical protein
LKKEKVSEFDQLLFRANLTADRIWLANLLCCAIGVQQQADNFVCTSIFLCVLTKHNESYYLQGGPSIKLLESKLVLTARNLLYKKKFQDKNQKLFPVPYKPVQEGFGM